MGGGFARHLGSTYFILVMKIKNNEYRNTKNVLIVCFVRCTREKSPPFSALHIF